MLKLLSKIKNFNRQRRSTTSEKGCTCYNWSITVLIQEAKGEAKAEDVARDEVGASKTTENILMSAGHATKQVILPETVPQHFQKKGMGKKGHHTHCLIMYP